MPSLSLLTATVADLSRALSDGRVSSATLTAAYMLDALAQEHPSRGSESYVSACSGTDLSGLRIGVPTSSLLQASDAPMEAFHKALRVLESCGANIVHGANYAGVDELNGLPKERQLLVLAGCFKTDIKEYLGNLTTKPPCP
jgi:Asp-tRNA(Asn)/Glu-tRNA(Gln) amidotransferase A subunit family amidase